MERRRFGYYSQIQHTGYCDIHIVDPFDPVETPVFLADARAFFGERLVYIFIHDPAIDRRLSDALERAGCTRGSDKLYLAHVDMGSSPAAVGPGRIEPVTRRNLLDYQIAKLKGFADSEEEPGRAAVESDLAIRRAELNADGSFLIARVGNEAAGIIGWYEGADRFIFHLATRAAIPQSGYRPPAAFPCSCGHLRAGQTVPLESSPIRRIHRCSSTGAWASAMRSTGWESGS